MPLHADDVASVARFDGFNGVVRRARRGFESRRQITKVLRQGYGRVIFANGELRGLQGFLGAFGEGQNAARQVLSHL